MLIAGRHLKERDAYFKVRGTFRMTFQNSVDFFFQVTINSYNYMESYWLHSYSCFFIYLYIYVFSMWVFIHKHSQITGLKGKWEGILLTPHYHFHPLHRHLDISRTINPESSPLRIDSSRVQTQVAKHYAARPIYLYICPLCILIYFILIRFFLYLSKCPWCSVYLRSGTF